MAAFVSVCVFGTLAAALAGTLPNISGTWYAQGDAAKHCQIQQSGTNVSLSNEVNDRAHGTFTDPSTLSVSWPKWHNSANIGPRITYTGHISSDLRVIHWSNGTYWSRRSH
ncbi:MAG TPA: hypothetical protein VHX17_05625 [Candidatus Cybelea sp.]|nr:hypothetical protein [Candidatus Cybelea sp.]